MNDFFKPYYSGAEQIYRSPLSRFLPPLPVGMVRTWLQANIPQGSWILDPFGTHPMLALEAVKAGYNILVACNNPVLAFILETLASAPQERDFDVSLSAFDMIRRGGERVVSHLESIYITQCNDCKKIVPVKAFLWKKNETQPYAKIYQCKNCGFDGERPATAFDFEQNLKYASEQHKVRAVERTLLGVNASRNSIEEMLRFLLPRQIYFLFTLLSRLEGYSILSQQEKRLLTALFISICDEANVLWPYPVSRLYPKQLSVPAQYRETNLWTAFQTSIKDWSQQIVSVPVSYYPNLPQGKLGICLYKGRIRDIPSINFSRDIPIQASILLLPRPNQAFWSLSTLWASWLWGKKNVILMQNVFDRKRYDWQWHTHALNSVIRSLNNHIQPDMPIFAIAPDIVRGFLLAIIAAGVSANLSWEGLAYQITEALMQFHFKFIEPSSVKADLPDIGEIRNQIKQFLIDRNQPANYLQMNALCLKAFYPFLLNSKVLEAGPRGVYQNVQTTVDNILQRGDYWTIYTKGTSEIENHIWWLSGVNATNPHELTISDKVERDVLALISDKVSGGITFEQVVEYLYHKHMGLNTPDLVLIRLCLESYGEGTLTIPQKWQIKQRDIPAIRKLDFEDIVATINKIGKDLGFQTRQGFPIFWDNHSTSSKRYVFYPITTCMVGQYVFDDDKNGDYTKILVLPGSRARLFIYKIGIDPRLEQALDKEWRVIKFRQIRQFLERENPNLATWEGLLDLDPILWDEAIQLNMFDQK